MSYLKNKYAYDNDFYSSYNNLFNAPIIDEYNNYHNNLTVSSNSNNTNSNVTTANFSDIIVDGISITETLKSINEIKKMLLILQRDTEMEERYPELKEAYDNYNKILKELQVLEKLVDGHENLE